MSCILPKKCYLATAVMAMTLLLQGCASQEFDRARHFDIDPLVAGKSQQEPSDERDSEIEPGAEKVEGLGELTSEQGPQAPRVDIANNIGDIDAAGQELEGEPIKLDVHNLALPVFINEVFGEKLGLSYSLAPALSDQADLVTLRLSDPLPPAELFRTARSVLADYGVAINKQDGVWRFTLSDEISTEGVPLLISGEALPEVPVSHRPVFQIIELEVVRNSQVRGMVSGLFRGRKLDISEDPMRNAIILRGPADLVEDAAAAVRFFDRPVLKGRNSVLLRPAYREVSALSSALQDLLAAQGYSVGDARSTSTSVILLPMPELEVIVALANDQATLDHVQDWASRLDQNYQREIDTGMFLYEVQNTSAANLASLITQLYTGSDSEEGGAAASRSGVEEEGSGTSRSDSERSGRSADSQPASSTEVAGGRLVVDERRNILVFRGSGHSWMELKGVVEKLDKQVPSVLMEVLLAEVTLSDTQGTGVEWEALGEIGDLSGTLGTLDNLGIGGRGFSYTLNSAGETRAVLNAFYDSNRAVIRSSPKIMVKSGETANIQVGNEIPVLTSTRSTDLQTDGDSDVLNQYQFRQTGVTLTVEPIVQASGLVDIHISQELSETQDTGSGDSFLPTILNRSVETSLTLRDGGSVVLGGLISRSNSDGEQGVPLLGRIPLVGRLFKTQSDTSSTTELMIMVVPYVIRDDAEAQRISNGLKQRIRESEFDSDLISE